jgi:hypothetical protein
VTAYLHRLILVGLAGLFFCGCASLKPRPPVASRNSLSIEKTEIRNNAASLLYDLLGNEKNVSKILIIKRNSEELGRLIKTISETTGDYHKQLEQLALNDPNLNLHTVQLPPGEKAARDAVAKTKKHELLFTSGKEFEFNLLLTQAEALSYGGHLAQIASENCSRPEQVQTFKTISVTMENLYSQVIAQMRQGK